VIGVAPSHALMREIAEREAKLAARGGFVLPPEPEDAVPASEPIASEALRTVPPRENGGNLDVRQLTRGTTLLIPVWSEGALFSIGDAHFAQGDSECCGTAIEINATFSLEFALRKGEAARRHIRDAQFSREEYFLPPELAAPKRFHATTGLSVGRDGENFSENATVAAQNALLNMIDHIQERYGYTRAQAYAICSVGVDLKLSELVDAPNFVVSAFLPLDIFQE
jgi:formamidase